MLIKKRPPVEPTWLVWRVPASLNLKPEIRNTPSWVVQSLLLKKIVPVEIDGLFRGVDVYVMERGTSFHVPCGDFVLRSLNTYGAELSWLPANKFQEEYEVVSENCEGTIGPANIPGDAVADCFPRTKR
jgi:hypothetical protein